MPFSLLGGPEIENTITVPNFTTGGVVEQEVSPERSEKGGGGGDPLDLGTMYVYRSSMI